MDNRRISLTCELTLSSRQKEIIAILQQGLPETEVAIQLSISSKITPSQPLTPEKEFDCFAICRINGG